MGGGAEQTPGSRTRHTAEQPLAAVLVCADEACGGCGAAALEALRPLVAHTPRAVLVRSGCVHPRGGCRDRGPDAPSVRLQRCTGDPRTGLRPHGPSHAVDGASTAEAYRQVERWLDEG
ncbi:hypothetical protein [Nocardioides bruguierae]|uniref:Uncharacterized protein n=1 Tax=Nocardioides bruguierae TaxID=2945102 RepID=A0A9X2DBC2_9ACTN|nr:hypothetical protein [Nocardioides bruguierae]MCM0622826.1 hypothetical protein [Nocardioides bruguierae]